MKLQQLVDALDAQILSGDIVGAFDKFAADNCVTLSNAQDVTPSKAHKLEILNWFFQNIADVKNIERKATAVVGDAVTESQFVFEFVNRQGQPLVYNEVIRRTWQDGKMVEEQYLVGKTIDVPVKTAAKKPSKKDAPKEEKPGATTSSKATKKAEPKADKKPAAKSAKAAVKADDLTLIEGIGPKIAELLVKGGIANFEQLAAAKPQAIKTILDAAGKRYQMHDPSTWPQQATLARDGKTAELKKLQDKLKAGRK